MTPEDGQSEVDRNVVSLMITITIKVANWSLNTSNCIPPLKNQTNHCQMRKRQVVMSQDHLTFRSTRNTLQMSSEQWYSG